MTLRKLPFLTATLLLPIVATAQTSQAPTRQTLKGDSVAIYNLVGELHVDPGSGSDVVVEISRGGADASRLEVQSGPIRGRETLRIIYPDDATFGDAGSWGGGSRNRGWREGREVRIGGRGSGGLEAFADLRVTVPAGKSVALYLGVGKTFVTNVDGHIRVHVAAADVAADRTRGSLGIATGSGNVDVRDATGEVALETGSGDITLSGMTGPRLQMETGSGNVTLMNGKATEMHIETGSGDVEVTGASGDNLTFNTGSGNINVGITAAFTSLDIETGSGNVTLKVPPTIGAEVDLDTGSGDIDLGGLTLMVRRIERDHVTGTIGDGKGRLSVETGSGNVRLVKF